MQFFKKIIKNTILEKYARILISLIPYNYRILDKEFYNFLNLLHENENKSYDEIKQYQFNKLKQQVEMAYRYSDFYYKKYNDYGFSPTDLKCMDDIKKIPLLSKDEVRENSNKMLLTNNTSSVHFDYTSGTTGKPLKLFSNKKILSKEWASICYQWERIGYNPGDSRIELRGFIDEAHDFIELPDQRVLRINIIKLSKNNIEKVIKKIKELNYKFIHGYPSAIYKFTKVLLEANIEFNVKAIMFASEIIYDWQLELIDNYFKSTPKISHYGQAEKVLLGAWDRCERKYHFIPSYGLFEIDSETREIIGTGFINDIMPLIRYKMTDTVENYFENPSKQSNKTLFPIISQINGRQEEYTYNEKGDLIPPAVVTFPFKHLNKIMACKIIQNKINDFDLFIEGKDNKELMAEANSVIKDLKKIYGSNAVINLNILDKIPVDKSGKFRWIECKIK